MLNHRTASKSVSFTNAHGKTISIVIPPPSKQVQKAMNDYNNRFISLFNQTNPPKKSSGSTSKLSTTKKITKKK
jgi:hypothetical protein